MNNRYDFEPACSVQLAAERSETIPRPRDPKGETGRSSQSDISNLQFPHPIKPDQTESNQIKPDQTS